MPRPARCSHLRADDRGYPVIATIGQEAPPDFGTISEQRKLVLATFDLCAICALPFHDELRWQVIFEDAREDIVTSEAPVHEVCGLYAAQVCPFVSSPYARLSRGEGRKGERRSDFVALNGYRATKTVFGKSSEIQPDAVLHFGMVGYVRRHLLRSHADAAAAYSQALAAETEIKLDEQEARIVELLTNPTEAEGEDSGGVMAGAAWIIGAGFCSGATKVQGLDRYNTHPYTSLAVHALSDRVVNDGAHDHPEQHMRAALHWLATRDRMPSVLVEWRRDGKRRFSRTEKPGTNRGSAAERRRVQRKNQSAARRNNRR